MRLKNSLFRLLLFTAFFLFIPQNTFAQSKDKKDEKEVVEKLSHGKKKDIKDKTIFNKDASKNEGKAKGKGKNKPKGKAIGYDKEHTEKKKKKAIKKEKKDIEKKKRKLKKDAKRMKGDDKKKN